MADSDAVESAFLSAAAKWPGVAVTRETFTSYLELREIPLDRLEQRGCDLFLAAAVSNGDRFGLRAFETEIAPTTQAAVRRYGDDDFVAEVLQRLRVHLLVDDRGDGLRIARYDGRASLRSWVGVCAVRMALYMLRGERSQRAIGLQWTEALADLPTGDHALDEVKGRYADAFRAALRVASQRISKRERAVLRLRFAHGVSVDDIAATYAVHRVTAWRWLTGAKESLLEHSLRELRLAIPSDEVSLGSLLALVESRIELSVAGLFVDEKAPLAG